MRLPKVTFFLMSYNHGSFLRKSIRSVLAQQYDNLEILISDDASTDDSAAIIEQETTNYKGPHSLQVNINPQNLCYDHLNKICELCSGELLIMGHGDDMFDPRRTARVVQAWKQTGASLITSNATVIDVDDNPIGSWYDPDKEYDVSLRAFSKHYNIATGFGAAMSFTKELWKRFGPLPEGPRQMDILYTFRAALHGGNAFINEPLVYYRDHGHNMSLWAMEKSAKNDFERVALKERDLCNKVANLNRMIETLEEHLQRNPTDADALFVRKPLWDRLQKISMDWTVLRHRMALDGHGIL